MSGAIQLIVNGNVRHSVRYNTKKERDDIISDWKKNFLKGNDYQLHIAPSPVQYVNMETISSFSNRKFIVRDEYLLHSDIKKIKPLYSNNGHLKTIEKYA